MILGVCQYANIEDVHHMFICDRLNLLPKAIQINVKNNMFNVSNVNIV